MHSQNDTPFQIYLTIRNYKELDIRFAIFTDKLAILLETCDIPSLPPPLISEQHFRQSPHQKLIYDNALFSSTSDPLIK